MLGRVVVVVEVDGGAVVVGDVATVGIGVVVGMDAVATVGVALTDAVVAAAVGVAAGATGSQPVRVRQPTRATAARSGRCIIGRLSRV